MTEKILARAAGRETVTPGEIVEVAVDLVMTNDITAPLSIREFKKTGLERVFDPEKVVLVPDHFVPPSRGTARAYRKIWICTMSARLVLSPADQPHIHSAGRRRQLKLAADTTGG